MPPHPSPPATLGAFVHVRALASGQFGTVHLYEDPATKEKRAVKACSAGRGSSIDDPQHELDALVRLGKYPHPCVSRHFCDHAVAHGRLIELEFVGGGELFDRVIEYLSAAGTVPTETARALFGQMVSGVEHMHCHGVCHLDLKLENVMLSADGRQVKVVDLGLWHDLERGYVTENGYRGSPAYMAPEVFANRDVDARRAILPYDGRAADVWSLGVCLFVMTLGFYPFGEEPVRAHYATLSEQQARGARPLGVLCGPAFMHAHYGPARLARLPEEVAHVLDAMLTFAPSARTYLVAVLSSEFLAGEAPRGAAGGALAAAADDDDAVADADATAAAPHAEQAAPQPGYHSMAADEQHAQASRALVGGAASATTETMRGGSCDEPGSMVARSLSSPSGSAFGRAAMSVEAWYGGAADTQAAEEEEAEDGDETAHRPPVYRDTTSAPAVAPPPITRQLAVLHCC